MSKLLTKSKYMNGLQCQKLLWLVFNDPRQIPPPDAATRFVFDQGHLVGELAQRLFPDGRLVPTDNFRGNLNLTRRLLADRRPLFEAGFMVDNLYSRVDILNPIGLDEWEIVEVKSSTSVKEENIQDVAFQRYCARKAGLPVSRCRLVYINNQYVKKGPVDPAAFFTLQDISEEVSAASVGLEERIADMFHTIASPVCPDIPVGVFCEDPYVCKLDCCWQPLGDHSVFTLYRGGKKMFDFYYDGILNLRDIPPDFELEPPQLIQKECEISRKPHIEPDKLRAFLATLRYPLYYLDFETISPAVPLFDGTRPYQRIPFQFSLHIDDGRELRHTGFLAEGSGDPRPVFLRRLREAIGPQGSLITYNQAFEEGVLKELAAAFPEYAEWVDSLSPRLADLLIPFRSFAFYDPAQKGSASLKNVLPALTGHSYTGMGFHNGDEASTAYSRVTFGQAPEAERQQVRADLEAYCGLDTEGMVWILAKLREITGSST